MNQVTTLLIDYYRDFGRQDHRRLHDIYSDNIAFKDPIHSISGIESLVEYFTISSRGLISCEFTFTDQLPSSEQMWLKWDMQYRHQRINRGQPQTLSGATHICFQEKVYFHQDFYDLGAMVYEHVPILGAGVRWVKQRLAR